MSDRDWFDVEGWRLADEQLRDRLRERGVDEETIIEWRDEAAERQRTEEADEPAAAAPPAEKAPLLTTPAEYVLGALLAAGALGPGASASTLERVRASGLRAPMFARERDQTLFTAISTVGDRGEPTDFMLVEAELSSQHRLEKAGGAGYLRSLARLVPAIENASHYARLLVDEATRRELEQAALRVAEATRNGGVTGPLRDRILAALEPPGEQGPAPEAIDAGSFVFDEPSDPADIRIWGDDTMIGWSAGEGFMLLGPDGVGKTTLGQQLALARAGLRAEVLGMPVAPDGRRVLYIAADRPRQAARSLRRMIGPLERAELAERMHVWRGPLAAMLNEDRTILARLARTFDAGTIIVDSLKDVAVDLATDEAGGRIATAFQHAIAAGIELLVLHHPRKPGVDQHRAPRELSDTYGSRLIYGVMGSVVLLWGQPGDSVVELRHLKQPVEEIGPYSIRHDHQRGYTTIERGSDLLDLALQAGTQGLTANAAATLVYDKDTPTKAETERIRAKLDRLTATDKLVKIPGRPGGSGGGAAHPTRYVYNGPAEALR